MAFILYTAGALSLALGGFIGATSMVSDIQIGLVVTALVGGLNLIGLGMVLGRLARLERPAVDAAAMAAVAAAIEPEA